MSNTDSTEKKSFSRREERQQALSLVFERLFRDDTAEQVFEDAAEARDAKISSYIRRVVSGVEEHTDEIDAMIEASLRGWKKNRISKVSLTILRIAVFEMLYIDSIPVSVSINEAVELAKSYATPEDASFVNGVLGSVASGLSKSGEA